MDQPTAQPPSLSALTTYLLSRTGKTARTRLAERLTERHLRLWHMAVLAALADFGPHAQRDLARRLSIDPSDTAKVVEELGALGYVERTRDPADRRRVLVAVTGTGRVALAELQAEAEAVQDELLAPLTPAEREQLAGMLGRVLAHLGI
ncbi:MarR family winged helix-turn-helix transcriptional regulator [Streptacidiphilus jiangxiensis]|uniref:DNA-binding transcriptional regulator, MarR family n=1 Tax=Streptacidiphilus jiangxiensis TaxID=235985 RepID=A0A1H7MRJ1_STRJI|nr:MarR family winged helix-turn-helix transcriptional regulator [Streptacidiphilus jiangxiensis]SEL13966.1 DNA-binding transcriptional regulator, MarR family [Streptacidiphilus jiangxiensis]